VVATAGAANQASSVQLSPGMTQVTTSGATNSVCLPTAKPGTEIAINNNSGQTVSIFGSNQFNTPGTQDTINAVAGSTAKTIANNTNTRCFVSNPGNWACISGT
jgi:hypothetical protein